MTRPYELNVGLEQPKHENKNPSATRSALNIIVNVENELHSLVQHCNLSANKFMAKKLDELERNIKMQRMQLESSIL